MLNPCRHGQSSFFLSHAGLASDKTFPQNLLKVWQQSEPLCFKKRAQFFWGHFRYNLCNKKAAARLDAVTSEHLTAGAISSSFLSKLTQPVPSCCPAKAFLGTQTCIRTPNKFPV